MIAALLFGTVPAIFLGRAKLPLASIMHDKVLHADASMNKADWLTGFAAMAGIISIGWGWWWADAVAGLLISLDVIHDGYSHLRDVLADVMGRVPHKVDHSEQDPVVDKVRAHLRGLPWVKDASVRLRDEGHVYFGEGFIVPQSDKELLRRLEEAVESAKALHWKMHDLVLTPVSELPK